MVRREPEDLLEVGEGLVDVVLVVEAEATDIDGVHVGTVLPQEVVGDLASVNKLFLVVIVIDVPDQ